jgi:hypothetical protein
MLFPLIVATGDVLCTGSSSSTADRFSPSKGIPVKLR